MAAALLLGAAPEANAVTRCHYNRYHQRVCVKHRSVGRQVAIVGGTTAGGALIGGLAGGPTGAVIGGAAGLTGGAIYNAKTRHKRVIIRNP